MRPFPLQGDLNLYHTDSYAKGLWRNRSNVDTEGALFLQQETK